MLAKIGLNVLLLLLMKLSSSYIQWQFIYNQKVNLKWTNNSCVIVGVRSTTFEPQLVALGLLGFLCPLFGAFLAKNFGFRYILRIGGILLWLPGSCFIVSYFWSNLTCEPQRGYPIWLSLFFILCLADPALLMMLIAMGDSEIVGTTAARAEFRGLLMTIYYAVAAVGQLLGILPYLLQRNSVAAVQNDLSLLACFIFTACSWFLSLPEDAINRPQAQPDNEVSVIWVKKCSQVVAFSIPFAAILAVGLDFSTARELSYYFGFSEAEPTKLELVTMFLPVVMFSIGTAITCVIIGGIRMLCSCGTTRKQTRLQAGVILETLLHAGLIALLTNENWSSGFSIVMFTTVSFAEGVSNALTVAGMYELMAALAKPNLRAVAIGLIMTTWSVTISLNVVVLLVLNVMPKKVGSVSPAFFLWHVVCVGLLLLSLLQLKLLTLPLAQRIEQSALSQEEADESSRLVEPTSEASMSSE